MCFIHCSALLSIAEKALHKFHITLHYRLVSMTEGVVIVETWWLWENGIYDRRGCGSGDLVAMREEWYL